MSIFQGKVAFVTGGGSGLGRALSEELARRGAVIAVTDINAEAAEHVAAAITESGGKSCSMKLDVSQPEDVAASIDSVVGRYGRLDYMFNNAGIIILGEVRDMGLEHWHRLIDVNLLGVLYGTTAAYSHMVRQGYGHIVNIASVGGLVPLPTYAAYAATKHAVVGLSTSMRPEASKLGVRITVVCPGTMNTGLGASATILHASREVLESNSRKKQPPMDPGVAAIVILRGVERNQRMIIFPFDARLLWWAHRIQPALLAPLESWFVRTLRAARTES
uniref:Short-chain dehydrogenase/reductase SDR n=1 Tax=Solibacter usitatus (strain Ellin6076) TaxID=234267 RepID=Q026V2_SOLUE